VAKMGQNYLPPALIALSFRKVMGYRYLNVRINSANDASISCEKFVKFGPVTSQLTGLICELCFRVLFFIFFHFFTLLLYFVFKYIFPPVIVASAVIL